MPGSVAVPVCFCIASTRVKSRLVLIVQSEVFVPIAQCCRSIQRRVLFRSLQALNASECGRCLTLTSLVAFNGKTRRLHVGECAYERSSTPPIFLCVFMFSQASFVCAVRYSLNLAVFLLQLALHFEIDLSFAFDTLLLHITDHTLMHCLCRPSAQNSPTSKSRMLTYGFIGHLLVVNEVNNTDRT